MSIFRTTITFALLFVIFSGLLSSHPTHAQDQHVADSLLTRIEREDVSDTLRYRWLYVISYNHADPEIKLDYARRLQELAKKNNSDPWLLQGLYIEGTVHRLSGDLTQALEVYFECVKLAEKHSLRTKLTEIYNEIANVCSVARNHQNALKYYQKAVDAIEVMRTRQDSLQLATTLTNMGDEYYNIEKLDSALILFEESGIIFDALHDPSGSAYNLGNIGLVYAKQNKYDQAEKALTEATNILDRLGDHYAVAIFEIHMADVYFKKGDLQHALLYGLKSYEISMALGLKEQVREASLKLSEIYESMGDCEEAFVYQKQYVAYHDSIDNEDAIQKMADLRMEYEVAQQQAEIDLLESQKLTQKVLFYSMIGLFLLLGGITYIFYKNYKQKDATNQLLASQKEEIAAQRDQLEAMNETRDRFFSIISHDMLGPVNSFKAFSTLLQHCIDKNDVKGLAKIYGQFSKSVDGLSALLANLLDWAITQQGSIPYHPEKVNLKVICDELVDLYLNMASAKNIEIISTIEPDSHIYADPNGIKTIMRNLINNSIKFTATGSITLAAKTTSDEVSIIIKDTGIGMTHEKLVEIMKTGDYNRSWGTQGEKGVGIGLQLVKELLSKNKGEISIESTKGVGTSIEITFPIWNPKK